MSYRRLLTTAIIVLGASFVFFGMGSNPTKQFNQDMSAQQNGSLIAGRNVNMVSGTTLPGGDPWLQRQNEPSIAVSTRNPQHLLAGANDYRTVDMPFSEGELPGIEGIATGDAWLGLFKSFDGGESWKTTLHPGFPQDVTNAGANSGLKIYSVAADPVVRAGAAGTFFYSGIAFTRTASPASCVFVSRFVDNNNTESADPIQYIDTKIIQSGNPLQFVDKPWLAVDKPRGSSVFNVYLAYSVFYGTAPTTGGAIMFARSTNSGQTWGPPIKLVEVLNMDKNGANQGATIAIDPQSGAVYAAWRNFDKKLKKASIYVAKSTNAGVNFGTPVEVAKNLKTFDQTTTGITFRTNAYPSMAVDKNGIVYLVWSERIRGEKGPACIMMTTSSNGKSWSKPWTVEAAVPGHQEGHQIMPTLTYAMGRLLLAWYDQRNDVSGMYTEYIDESYPLRRTVDVRMAVGTPGLTPTFEPSMQVSRYLFALTKDGSGNYVAEQVQFNPPDYPLFKGGTAPFLGDYVDVASSPAFVLKDGNWEFNTDPSETPVYHIAWTDNRDVRPPKDNIWTNYTPPSSDQGLYGSKTCGDVDRMGMRNQNIYTAKVSKLEAGAVANFKTLGNPFGYYPSGSGGGLIPRAFVLYVKNTSDAIKSFRLQVTTPQNVAQVTFVEFENIRSLDVEIAPYSSIARPLFVSSSNEKEPITVEVKEISGPGGSEVAGGLSTYIYLNPDPTNPTIPSGDPTKERETHTPNIMNPNIMNWVMVSPNIMNPNIMNPNIMNPNIMNPNIMNPNIMNPNIMNPNIMNPTIANPNIMNPNIMNPNIMNPNIMNPNIMNPNIMNATLPETAPVKDVTWRVTNEGNTATPFTFKMFSKEQMPAGIITQLLVYRVHKVPGILYSTPNYVTNDCKLREEEQHELLLNVANPNIMNPNIMNPNIMNPNIMNPNIMNTTFSIPPGEEVLAVLRVVDPQPAGTLHVMADGSIFNLDSFVQSVGAAATAHAVNTDDAHNGDTTPPAAATKLVIATTSLPDGVVNVPYSVKLEAAGGTLSKSWALNSGELPLGLILSSDGTISGTPTQARLYYFNVEVSDLSSPIQTDTQRYSIYIDLNSAPDTLTITTTSLPSGVKNYWYGATLEAIGGTWPRTWSLASGSLPPGFILDSGGTISGTPTANGTYSFKPKVTDKNGNSPLPTALPLLNIVIGPSTGTFVTISGTVYNGSQTPLSGVVMRGLPGTPITGTDGTYTATVAQGWSGIVEPFKVGSSFTPAFRSYSAVATSKSGENYNAVEGPLASFVVNIPSNAVAGTPFSVTITAKDAGGNTTKNVSGITTLSVDLGWITPLTIPASAFNDDGVWTGNVTLGQAGSRTITAGNNGKTGNAVILVAVPPTVQFEIVSASGSESLGGQGTIYLKLILSSPIGQAVNVSYAVTGGTATGGGVDYTLNSGIATIPANSTIGDIPLTVINDSLVEPDETIIVTISNPVNAILGTKTVFTYTIINDDIAPVGNKLAFTQSPNGGVGGVPWTVQPIVEVRDATDQRVTSDNSTQVTLNIKVNPGNGVLSGSTMPVTVSGGVATFGGLTIDKGGWKYALEATSSPTLQVATSGTFDIEGFSGRASMSAGRGYHSTTFLSSGMILIAGGGTPASGVYLASAELYDPVNYTYSSLPNMNVPRGMHTATLLLNGKVLIAGGGGFSNTAELFDPADNQFHTTGSMTVGRQGHRATLLQDGRVLITGGYGNTAELYNPATGTFTAIGSMTVPRYWHTSTWLPNGKVLLTGGNKQSDNPDYTASAELYDPISETFSSTTGNMASARADHTATLLTYGTNTVTVLIAGGMTLNGALATAEIFNLQNNSFSPVGNMNTPHVRHQAVLLRDGTVLIVGNAFAEIYNPLVQQPFRPTGPSAAVGVNEGNSAVTLDDGRIFVSGGTALSGSPTPMTEVWNPRVPFPTRVISGHVTQGGIGVQGVFMNGLPGNPVTDASGYYEGVILLPPAGWSGMVTPTKAGFTFNPPFHTYTFLTDNLPEQNFNAATVATYTISGRVTKDGIGLSDVLMNGGFSTTVTTDHDGYYTGTVDSPYTGTVTPLMDGYTFNPPSRNYTSVTSSQTAQDYTVSALKISGNVWDISTTPNFTQPLQGATLDFYGVTWPNDHTETRVTGANGYYEVMVNYNWSSTVSPAKASYKASLINFNYVKTPLVQDFRASTADRVVMTGPSSIGVNTVAGPYTLQSRNSGGNPANVVDDYIFTLTSSSSSSGTVTFSSDAAGNNQISAVTIPTGTNSTTFYYKDTVVGTPILKAKNTIPELDDWKLGDAELIITVTAPLTPTIWAYPTAMNISGLPSASYETNYGLQIKNSTIAVPATNYTLSVEYAPSEPTDRFSFGTPPSGALYKNPYSHDLRIGSPSTPREYHETLIITAPGFDKGG
jgi:hypothetical protein